MRKIGQLERIFRAAAREIARRRGGFCCDAILKVGRESFAARRAQAKFEYYFAPLPVVQGDTFIMAQDGEQLDQDCLQFMETKTEARGTKWDASVQGRRVVAMLFMAEICASEGV